MNAEKRRALGKGLSALIPDVPEPAGSSVEVDLDLLVPNEFQPRLQADEAGLERLAGSIRANGIIQPIVVRKVDGTYQIIAGERRWRAAQRAGLLKVPVVVREMPGDGEKLLQMALIENIQREDLNPIEEACAYQRLADQFRLTQDAIAASVGKDRSSVANFMRLLKLPRDVQQQVAAGAVSMGPARALLALESPVLQRRLAQDIVTRGLSVRQVEALVKKAGEAAGPKQVPIAHKKDVHTRAAEEQLHLSLGTPVRIVRRRKGGTIEVDFTSEDELQRLYEQLTRK